MMRLLLFLCIIACSAPFAKAEETAPVFSTLTVGGMTLRAEIADTPEARRLGLSHRAELPPGAGMLLVFAEPRIVCLWMRDVEFPLDAAFIDAAGTVVGVAKMQPHTEDLHCAPDAVKYALEAAAGFFANVQTGDVVLGLPLPETLPPQ